MSTIGTQQAAALLRMSQDALMRKARIAKQLSQPTLLTERIQPLRRPVLGLRKS